ncbi:MAG: BTAD domain-containing putative transcriptional regulator, partial [Armatimonadota bacterium]
MILQTQTLWDIQLFGGLRVSARNRSEIITRFRSQRYAALLSYLALYPNRQHSREELADMLWPEADPTAARTNLRTALASLRRQLEGHAATGVEVIQAVGRTHLQIVPEVICTDVQQFEKALLRARQPDITPDAMEAALREAIRHYRGPLLPGSYEPWALAERDRYAEAYQSALLNLLDSQERQGDLRGACETALLAVAADPLREEARALIIRQYRRIGDEAAAQRQFEEIERLLKEQFDVLPSRMLVSALNDTISPPNALPSLPSQGKSEIAKGKVAAPDRFRTVPDSESSARIVQLPMVLSRFFGRESEVSRLCDLLQGGATRLITLTGTGGSGKTRLAIETAKRLSADAFSGGIWFVSLADLRSAERVPEAITQALGLPASAPQSSPQEQIISAIAGFSGPVLLVLDNLEQLVEIGAPLQLKTLLERVPALTILATSRQSLGIEGEQEISVDPLPVPTLAGSPDRLMDFPSIQLFVNRAQAARPDFPFNARNAEAVAALCARLEGIPLAIELAAAWSQTLAPVQILQKMESSGEAFSFELLASRRRDIAPRHATLRNAITWSYELLAPDAQHFFAILSVFRGGWTLEAAEFVSNEPAAALLLAELQERSLLLSQEQEDGTMR